MQLRFLSFYVINLLAVILLFGSCQPSQTTCPVIDMDNPAGTIDLKLSDLLDNITIVPLETRDDLLLSTAGAYFVITDRYIIVDSGDKLLQFDHHGNYIKTLAIRGNGPNEYNFISAMLSDEKGEILYYTDFRNKESVLGINLNTGAFLEFPNPDLPAFSISVIDTKGNIYGPASPSLINVEAPASESENVPVLAYSYHPALKGSTVAIKGCHSFIRDIRFPLMFRKGDEISFLHPAYSDTLFTLSGDKMIPQYVIKLKNPCIDAFKGGVSLSFPLSGNWGTIIGRQEVRGLSETTDFSRMHQWLPYLFLDKKGALKTIKSITIDPIGVTIDMDSHLKQINELRDNEKIGFAPSESNLWGYFAMEASTMTALLNQALSSHQLSTVQQKIIKEVAANINDDSNPVLIMGKVR